MCLKKYGFDASKYACTLNDRPARITAVHREHFEYVSDESTGRATLKAGPYRAGGERFPTTGDFVLLDHESAGTARIIKTLGRTTCFSRVDPTSCGQGEQAVAANFDYVFILQSLDRYFNLRRLERYLTLSWQSGAIPVVLLTKSDLASDHRAQLLAAKQLAIGAQVFAVSAETGAGLEALGGYLVPGKTIVFLGSSGVGKSSLVNALAGEMVMPTTAVRESDGRGRHTTTHRQLILLDSGVMIIDTPGMRELGMWDVSEGMSKSFSDVEQYFGHCKFSNCTHRSEPGCAVKAAIRQNELSPERWESYVKLTVEARYADDKAGYLRDKERWHKEISLMIRRGTVNDYRHDPCHDHFICAVCGQAVSPESAGSKHRNHCPRCLSSVHVDNRPGDRASLCKGTMDAIGVWVRDGGEWAIIHRCRLCGALSSNRIAADDDKAALMALAEKPLSHQPFPMEQVP